MVLEKLDSYIKKNEIRTLPNTIQKNKLNGLKDLNLRPDAIKLLEENMGQTLFEVNCSKIFSIHLLE